MKNKILKLSIKDISSLSDRYIKQFKFGGIFITNESNFELGDEIFLVLNLEWIDESLAINSTVSYLSNSSSAFQPGIAVSFNNDKIAIDSKNKIEKILGNNIKLNNLLFK